MFNSFENAMLQPVLVTGGSGFIGSNFIHQWMQQESAPIINLDCLTYAANPANLASIEDDRRYTFVQGNICDRELLDRVLDQYQPRAIIHFAAESHVDRSIVGPGAFVQTNVNGTFTLLEAARRYWGRMDALHAASFRFLHVSTDEVFGSLSPTDPAFTEETAYAPNSPYSASKAASDHLVRAYFHTYGMPTLITNCSNNYGPFQFPEKLIPLMIRNATKGMPLPIYGDGMNVRDWLFVEDHCEALRRVLADGHLGDTYNIGGSAERTNLDVVTTIVDMLDELQPLADGSKRRSLLQFVKDRPGHDRRYAVNTTKIRRELGWQPREQFESGIRRTVEWYLREAAWVEAVCSGEYRKWISRQYSVTA